MNIKIVTYYGRMENGVNPVFDSPPIQETTDLSSPRPTQGNPYRMQVTKCHSFRSEKQQSFINFTNMQYHLRSFEDKQSFILVLIYDDFTCMTYMFWPFIQKKKHCIRRMPRASILFCFRFYIRNDSLHQRFLY